MKILSHRGHWTTADEKNAPAAFERSFAGGFGTETDLRDLGGRLVVAHDPPRDGALEAGEMLAIHARHGGNLTLALNVKADGLQPMLAAALAAHPGVDAFVFDMAVPDAIQWLKTDVPAFTRHSDVETEPAFYAAAAGVWLDAFDTDDWWDAATIARHREAGKRVCIVSPELHGRAHRPVWDRLRAAGAAVAGPEVMLCTDFPEEAREVFGHDG